MSDAEKMWDSLNCLPDAVEHLIYGDPDDDDAVKASDAVKWAIAEITRLREERRWVPVGERLPPVQGEDVLTLSFFSDGSPLVCIGWHNGIEWMHYIGRGPGLPVSHWHPLPPGPEAKEVKVSEEGKK